MVSDGYLAAGYEYVNIDVSFFILFVFVFVFLSFSACLAFSGKLMQLCHRDIQIFKLILPHSSLFLSS